ncbi:MAG TPA: transketolase [Spirochaetia bacterium]|nr:transketolase [Spirochaetia bacterium]
MRDRFVETAAALLEQSAEIAIVLAEISVSQFRNRAEVRRNQERLINVGIREQLLIGVAAGLAKEGLRPIVHTYAPFLVERAFEQVKLDFVHQGLGGVLVSVGASVDAAAAGRTHQAPEDVALISTLPDWTIFVPGHADEAEILLRRAAHMTGPVYMRLSEQTNAEATEITPTGWTLLQRGDPEGPTVIAVGPMLGPVRAALASLDAGASATLIYTTRPMPVDRETLRAAPGSADVVLVEPYLAGTGLAELACTLSNAPRRYLALGFPKEERRHYGTAAEHIAAAGLDAAGIAESLNRFLG